MIRKRFAVYDSAAKCSGQQFSSTTTATAIREFALATNKVGSPYHAHPADFGLFELGTYDDETMRSTDLEQPHPLGLGIEFLEGNE